jgi:quinate dehydrogenase (quinone)
MPQIGAPILTEADMWGMTPFDQLACRVTFKGMRYDGLFTAPGEDLLAQLPRFAGRSELGRPVL